MITQKSPVRSTALEAAREERSGHTFARTYDSLLKALLRRSYLGPLFAIVVLGATYLLYTNIGSDFMPEMDESSLMLDPNSGQAGFIEYDHFNWLPVVVH